MKGFCNIGSAGLEIITKVIRDCGNGKRRALDARAATEKPRRVKESRR
jgi:hypothetical protein